MKDDLTDKMAESYQNNGMPIALKVSFDPQVRSLTNSISPMEVLVKSSHSSVEERLRIKA
jgi:hypothetical protein